MKLSGILAGILIALSQTAHSQLDSTVEKLLVSVFEDKSISESLFTNKYPAAGSAFLYVNNTLLRYISNYSQVDIQLNSGFAPVFLTTIGQVYLFKSEMELNHASNFMVHTIVVVDRLKIGKNTAKILFHTTSLESDEWRQSPRHKFLKFKCFLELRKSQWFMKRVKRNNFGFRSIAD